MLKGLVKLIRHMDGLTGPAEEKEIHALLRDADVSRNDMINACRFNNVTYARTLMAKSEWYELLIICWREGQCSPIHDHSGSLCGVRIVDGTATELTYQQTSPGFVRFLSQRDFAKGAVLTDDGSGIHLIRNQQKMQDLITLHLYSPRLSMNYYELESDFQS